MTARLDARGIDARKFDSETVEASPFQITAAGMLHPLHIPVAFNVVAALSAYLLGHPVIAACGFLVSSASDALFRHRLAGILKEGADTDNDRAFNRLGIDVFIRNVLVMAPVAVMALNRAGAEIAYMGVMCAIGTLLAFTHGSLSRRVFWAHAAPSLAASVLVTLADYPFAEASGVLIGFVTLIGLLVVSSNGATKVILSWQAAFSDSRALIADLRTARDQAVMERIAADAAREEAKKASKAKSNFLANMSHELRTPLNAILGFSEMLGSDAFAAKRVEYSALIHQSGRLLLALVNDVLDLSKLEVGQMVLHSETVHFRPLARSCIEMLRAKAEAGHVRLIVQVTGEPAIWADERAMRQILLNLITNAVKFTPPGGDVTTFAAVASDGTFVFGVRDTGMGIAEADFARVFESFGQGRHDAITDEKGTGLGLPIVKGLASAHDGEVTLQSAVGVGTTVTIILPAQRSRSAHVVAQFSEGPGLRSTGIT